MTDFMHSVAGAASNLAIGFSIAPALYRIHMAWSEGEDSKARGHLVHSAMQALKHLEDHIKQLKSRIRLHQPPWEKEEANAFEFALQAWIITAKHALASFDVHFGSHNHTVWRAFCNKRKRDLATAPLALKHLNVASRVLASSGIAKYYIPKDDFRAMMFACTLFLYGEIMIDHPSPVGPRDLDCIIIQKQHAHPLVSLKTCFVSNRPPMDIQHNTAMS